MEFPELRELKLDELSPGILGRRASIVFMDGLDPVPRRAVGTVESYVVAGQWLSIFLKNGPQLSIDYTINPQISITIYTDSIGR